MGNAASLARASTALDSYVAELGNDISYEKSLSPSRFLKTILVRHTYGLLVVKLFVKPDPSLSLRVFRRRLNNQRDQLDDVPNIFTYQTFVETEKAGYLIRQWAGSSLYDRISTRPYLAPVEKKWIAFQILSALGDARSRDVAHGDLKSENILILPSLSVLVTDFASAFKPTYLPLNDPTEFSFFYDSSGRRTCYIAPERFYDDHSKIAEEKRNAQESLIKEGPSAWLTGGVAKKDGKVTEEMDVFSAGCVLLEMWSDGAPFFSLSDLFVFREGNAAALKSVLDTVEDVQVQSMLANMLALDPNDRPTFEKILADFRNSVFPDYFYTFLQDYTYGLNDNLNTHLSGPPQDAARGRADEVIRTLKRDCTGMIAAVFEELEVMSDQKEGIPGMESNGTDSPALLLLNIITSNVRNCLRASSKLDALQPILSLSQWLTDEEIIDRIIPFIVTLLRDDMPQVRSEYLKALIQLLGNVRTIAVSNLGLITEYVLPHVRHLAEDEDVQVRCVFAETLPLLAEIGMTMLELGQVLKESDNQHFDVDASLVPDYDMSVRELHDAVEDIASSVLVDPSSDVKRAALINVGRLCLVFGRSRTNDVLLSRMITYLNDKDWRLRYSFLASIVTVAAFVGPTSLEEFVLPLMEQALIDPEDFVVARVLASLASLVELGLLAKGRMLETFSHIYGFLCHPSSWIRQTCAVLIEKISFKLRTTDTWCIMYPYIRPLLDADLPSLNMLEILDVVQQPLSRKTIAAAKEWASTRSPWWALALTTAGSRDRKRAFRMTPPATVDLQRLISANDKAQLQTLREQGLQWKDDIKLAALRSHIVLQATSPRLTHNSSNENAHFAAGRIVSLQTEGVTPFTIFITPRTRAYDKGGATLSRRPSGRESASLPPSLTANKRSSTNSSSLDGRQRLLSQHSTDADQVSELRRRLATIETSGHLRTSVLEAASLASLDDTSGQTDATDTSRNSPPESNASTAMRPKSTLASDSRTTKSRLSLSGESQKTAAAISAVRTHAHGQLEAAASMRAEGISHPRTPERSTPGLVRSEFEVEKPFASSYEGTDRGIQAFIEENYRESLQPISPDLGPLITKGGRPKQRRAVSNSGSVNRSGPVVTLISHIVVHSDSILGIVVSPDEAFLAIASRDGLVSVWDVSRFERNVTPRPRLSHQTIHKLTAFCGIESTYCLAVAGENGGIQILRILSGSSAGFSKSSKIVPVQYWQATKDGGFITHLKHIYAADRSRLFFATSTGQLGALDMRTGDFERYMRNPAALGTVSTICINSEGSWMVVGTESGFVSLWDLRYQLLLRVWKIDQQIVSSSIRPQKGQESQILLGLRSASASGTIMIALDLFTEEVVDKHNVMAEGDSANFRSLRLESMSIDGASDVTKSVGALVKDFKEHAGVSRDMDQIGNPSISVSAIARVVNNNLRRSSTQHDSLLNPVIEVSEHESGTTENMPPSFVLTGGDDRVLRAWAYPNGDDSFIISGSGRETERRYKVAQSPVDPCRIWAEFPLRPISSKFTQSRKKEVADSDTSAHHRQLLKPHLDTITAIETFETPFSDDLMVASGDRSGCVKVWRVGVRSG